MLGCFGYKSVLEKIAFNTDGNFEGSFSLSGVSIVADACIDNKAELYRLLDISLQERSNISDECLILEAYYRWGFNCPKYILGDFSFAIWDSKKQKLFCARDHIGAKPFYYSLEDDQIVFSNNLNQVLSESGVSQCFNDSYIATFLRYRWYYHPEQTFYKKVQRLLPGHCLIVTPRKVQIEQYWFPADTPSIHYSSSADYVEAFREIFTQVIKDCLNTNLSIGAHLSGGLDSSYITVLAARELKSQDKPPPLAYCWQPRQQADSDSDFEYKNINSATQQEGLRLNHLSVTMEDCLTTLKSDVTRYPNDGNLIRENVVQRVASDAGVQILLSGFGGDEFASDQGKMHYLSLIRSGKFAKVWNESTNNPLKFLAAQFKYLLDYETAKHFKALRLSYYKPIEYHYTNDDFSQLASLLPGPPYLDSIGVREQQLHYLSMGYHSHRLEAWHNSAAQRGIVYRYPLLDRRIIEFVLGVPPEQIRHGGVGRLLMRNAMKGFVPENIRTNIRKDEPSYSPLMAPVLGEALKRVGEILRENPSPSRSDYINMPKLIADLTKNLDTSNPKFGRCASALLFLDW